MKSESGKGQKTFFTPGLIVEEQTRKIESSRGRLLIASCQSGSYLASMVAGRYQELLADEGSEGEILYLENIDFQFSDSETCVRLDIDVSGYDVFLFQALYDPVSRRAVDQNYMAFLMAARAFREWGANSITAVLPYLAYTRQDKPTRFQREPTSARLMADLSVEAGLDRIVTWHPHSSQIRGFYGHMPVDELDSITFFTDQFRSFNGRSKVIVVAPDAGASKFVTYFSRALNLKSAVASKYRPRPEEAMVSEIMGDFFEKRIALILDDMISTGGTVYALVRELVEKKGIEEVYLGASHNLCMESAWERLMDLQANYHLREVVVTNSIPQTDKFKALPFFSVRSLADILSRVINRIHYNREVSELFS